MAYIGEADILIGADATNLARDVQRQAQANLKAAGANLGRSLSDSLSKAASSSAGKFANDVVRDIQKIPAAARAVGSQVQKHLTSAVSNAGSRITAFGKSATSTFGSLAAAAQRLPGPLGAFANVATSAFGKVRTGVQNLIAGWRSSQAGLSSFTGAMGTMGTIARSVTSMAGSAIRSGFSAAFSAVRSAGLAAWNAIKSGADKLWSGLKSGAAAAAKTIGQTLKVGLQGMGAAAGLAAGAAVGTGIVKGFGRLSSLDTAQKRFEGLGLAAKDIGTIMESVNKSIDGTSFSMDEAANAASMFATAGVKAGADMDAAMSGLSAAASASGKSMTDILPVVNKIAGSGRIMGGELEQLTENGVPALSALSSHLGKSADEVRKLASDGQISFADFNAAMTEELGGLVDTMATTWPAMRGNVVANLGRIGAAAQEPIFNALMAAMPGVVQMFRNLAGAVSELMEPLADRFTPAAEAAGKALAAINFTPDGITDFTAALGPLLPLIGAFVAGPLAGMLSGIPVIGGMFQGLTGPIGLAAGALAALVAIKPETLSKGFDTVLSTLQTELPGMMTGLVNMIAKGLRNLVQNLPTMLNGIIEAVQIVLQSIIETLPHLIPLLVGAIGQMIPTLVNALLTAIPMLIAAAFQLFQGLVTGLLQSLPGLISTLVSAIPMLIETLVAAVPMMLDAALQMFTGILDALIIAVPLVLDALVSALPTIITAIVEAIPKIIDAGIQFFLSLIDALFKALPLLLEAVISAIPQILDAIVGAIPQLIDAGISLFLGLIDALVTAIPMVITTLIELLPMIFEAIIGAIPQIIEAAFTLFLGIIEGLWNAIPKIWEAVTEDLLPSIWDAITGGGDDAEESGKNIGERAATGLSSTSTQFSTAGTTLGQSATSGLSSTAPSMVDTAGSLAQGASSTLSSYSGEMSTAGAGLGQGAVSGLAGQKEATRGAAADLANAATVDVTAKVAETEKAGKQIAASFAVGINKGVNDATKAANNVAAGAQKALGQVSGFITVGQTLASGIATGINNGAPRVYTALTVMTNTARARLVAGVVNSIGNAFATLWAFRLSPTLNLMVNGFAASMSRIRNNWASTANSLTATYNSRIRTMLSAFSNAVRTGPPTAFQRATSAIIREWNKIKEAAAKPARFVVNTVMNGMIGAMNKIPGVKIPRIGVGFARGGVLPGYDPVKRDTILTPMRAGEGVLVPEVVKGLGEGTIHALNAAGNRGGAAAVRAQFGPGRARGGLIHPLPSGRLTAGWLGYPGHRALDFAAPAGTPVRAAGAGVVRTAGWNNQGLGYNVDIGHANGLITRYSHMLANLAVRAGQMVKQAQTIGYVGSTGNSTGPHLHYEVHRGYQNRVNPTAYLGGGGAAGVPGLDIVSMLASEARQQFSRRFGGGMFNQAAGAVLGQAVKGLSEWGMKKLANDVGVYDQGGWLPHGGMGLNLSGKPEAVFTNAEATAFKELLQSARDGGLGGGFDPRQPVEFVLVDQDGSIVTRIRSEIGKALRPASRGSIRAEFGVGR